MPDARTMPCLSIVIPVGPREDAWPKLLTRLEALADSAEIILSACGPTPPIDRSTPVRWISGPSGRAGQLNRGVAEARGSVLWLLHADSEPDAACLDAVRRFSGSGFDAIGWFDLAFSSDGPRAAAINAWGANLRSRLLELPFGDQGWVLPKSLFERLGGFDPGFGRGEDLEFIVRARRAGIPMTRLDASLRSSARRYREQGWLRTTLDHLVLTVQLHRRAKQLAGSRTR